MSLQIKNMDATYLSRVREERKASILEMRSSSSKDKQVPSAPKESPPTAKSLHERCREKALAERSDPELDPQKERDYFIKRGATIAASVSERANCAKRSSCAGKYGDGRPVNLCRISHCLTKHGGRGKHFLCARHFNMIEVFLRGELRRLNPPPLPSSDPPASKRQRVNPPSSDGGGKSNTSVQKSSGEPPTAVKEAGAGASCPSTRMASTIEFVLSAPPGKLGVTLHVTKERGAVIETIDESSPFWRKARVGDSITTINGRPIATAGDLRHEGDKTRFIRVVPAPRDSLPSTSIDGFLRSRGCIPDKEKRSEDQMDRSKDEKLPANSESSTPYSCPACKKEFLSYAEAAKHRKDCGTVEVATEIPGE